jgi:hypothetical protein
MKIIKFTLRIPTKPVLNQVSDDISRDMDIIFDHEKSFNYMVSGEFLENDSISVFYLYLKNIKKLSKVVDVFIKNNILISYDDITEGVKKDFTKFNGINKPFDNRLLKDFFDSEFTMDDALDRISEVGIKSLNEYQKTILK